MVIIQEIVKSKHFYKVHVILSILQMLNCFILITTLWCILLWCILLLSLFLYKWGNWDPGRLNDLTNVTQLVSGRGKENCSVMSNSLQPHGLQPSRLLHPWGSSDKNTGVGCHALLQGIFPTQESNSGLLHWRKILYPWATREGQ